MSSSDLSPVDLDSSTLTSLHRKLAAISEQAHWRYRIDGAEPFIREAVGLGQLYGWRAGSRRGTNTATTAVSSTADQFIADPVALRISDWASEIWNTAGTMPRPTQSIDISDRDFARGPGVVAVLGTIAYHDAWHAAHQAASAAVLRTLDEQLGPTDHGQTWPQIRAAATAAVQADRLTGPFAVSPTASRGFVPLRRGAELITAVGADGSSTLRHVIAPGHSEGRRSR